MKENKAGHSKMSTTSSLQPKRLHLPNKRYYLIGKGRLGLQLSRYFTKSQIPFAHLDRSSFSNTKSKDILAIAAAPENSIVLLAISDPSIVEASEDLFSTYGEDLTVVHFSASVQNKNLHSNFYGFHPLYSFTSRNLSSEEFEKVPFIADEGLSHKFTEIFPELRNPVYELNTVKDPLYHALAVLLGNLPITLSKLSADVLSKKGLPREALIPFLESVLENFKDPNKAVASGPIARKDKSTLTKHLESLNDSPFLKSVYLSFIENEWPNFSAETSNHNNSNASKVPKETSL